MVYFLGHPVCAVPLWSEANATAGGGSFINRVSCVSGYDNSSDFVPSDAAFCKYIDELPRRADAEGTDA